MHVTCRWVAHPALVTIAKEIFDEHMKTPNQIHVAREDVQKGAADLLKVSAKSSSFRATRGTSLRFQEPCDILVNIVKS